jgi:hypothetical protein
MNRDTAALRVQALADYLKGLQQPGRAARVAVRRVIARPSGRAGSG